MASPLIKKIGEKVPGWGDLFTNVPQVPQTIRINQEESARRKEAEEAVHNSGIGNCEYCKEEIRKNNTSTGGGWIWESEALLGFCDVARDRKHKPLVKWNPEEGVHNA